MMSETIRQTPWSREAGQFLCNLEELKPADAPVVMPDVAADVEANLRLEFGAEVETIERLVPLPWRSHADHTVLVVTPSERYRHDLAFEGGFLHSAAWHLEGRLKKR